MGRKGKGVGKGRMKSPGLRQTATTPPQGKNSEITGIPGEGTPQREGGGLHNKQVVKRPYPV